MTKTISLNKNYFIISIFVIIVIIVIIIISYYIQNRCLECSIDKCQIADKLNDINRKIENYQDRQNNSEVVMSRTRHPDTVISRTRQPDTVISRTNYQTSIINRNPKTINSLDRIYNPIRYPYKSDNFYEQDWYPNLELPFQVISGGYRNTPTLGGTEIPIYNPPQQLDISNRNIAPINISTQGPIGIPQQIGVLFKINGNDNDILPLFGRRKYPNGNKYEYYAIIGRFGSKVPIITKNRNDELGSNDIVFIKNSKEPYRVTIYENDFPQYIPYM